MIELKVYKFLSQKDIETCEIKRNGKDDVIVFIPVYLMQEWQQLIPSREEGLDCVMKKDNFVFSGNEICDILNCDLRDIFDDVNTGTK